MNLTDFQKRLLWGVVFLSIISLWIAFPIIFKALIESYKLPENFNNFGAFGDIYGSLNTLISSIALCAVAYSTWLQIRSLNDTREMNKKQLVLTKEIHDEQITESRNAIFTTKFYSLLNYKNEKLNSIVLNKKKYSSKEDDHKEKNSHKVEYQEISGIQAIEEFSREFYKIMPNYKNSYPNFNQQQLVADFYKVSRELGYETINILISYFHIYMNLCDLIKNQDMTENEKDSFKSILSNSMFQSEQVLLFWLTPMFDIFELENTEIFTQIGCVDAYIPFAKKFHKSSHFRYEEWKEVFQ
ncbi:hypothetical protein MCL27_03500 [Acinetobacter pittii]|uniref:hypothetical protein n=1 Tax=Acinetobacter pittii TaxID=48296 RepID=UPI001EE5E5F2|nr:hypothetical protein [Acinetobacter pittii]MCG5264091.1 hypothetical protein [Acinetobacter pittii]